MEKQYDWIKIDDIMITLHGRHKPGFYKAVLDLVNAGRLELIGNEIRARL